MAITIAACIIVKDGAATIERAISSVRAHVDEVCVYDTGSTDVTLELLEQLAGDRGAPIRVQRGEWRDDFSWARTQSFAMGSSDFALWIDDDEWLEGGERLRGQLDSDVLFVRHRNELAADDPDDVLEGWHPRVVRTAANVAWHGRVHEFLRADPSEESVRYRVAPPASMRFVEQRFAHRSHATRHDYQALVEDEYAETGDRRLANHVAISLLGQGRVSDTIDFLEAFVASFKDDNDRMCEWYWFAHLQLAESLWRLGRLHEARAAATEMRRIRFAWNKASRQAPAGSWLALRHLFDSYDEFYDPENRRTEGPCLTH